MFSFIKKKLGWGQGDKAEPAPAPAAPLAPPAAAASPAALAPSKPTSTSTSSSAPDLGPAVDNRPVVDDTQRKPTDRRSWLDRLKSGLRKTGSSIAQVFTGTQIDDALYEELEAALLMADAGVAATEHLLKDLKQRVKDTKATNPSKHC